MKLSIALTLASALSIGNLSAQECPAQKAKSCEAKSCETSLASTQQSCGGNSVTTAFNKLNADQKKKVSTALVTVMKSCPMGSKVPGTITALDRLYTEALTSMKDIAKKDGMPDAIRADAKKAVVMLTKLSSMNKDAMTTLKTVASAASSGCCAETAKKDCDASCAESKEECCDAVKACSISSANEIAKKWSTAAAEFEKVSKCEQTMAGMKKNFAVLTAHKIDVQNFVTKNLQAQMTALQKQGGMITCSKGGIMAKNQSTCDACSWTNERMTKTVGTVKSAHKLLGAMFASFAAGSKKKAGSCESSKSECEASKAKECPSTKVKQ